MNAISINITDLDGRKHTIAIEPNLNLSLMDVVRDAGFAMGNCGGMALCASCHCYVFFDKKLNFPLEEEQQMLDQLPNSSVNNSRLICQIPLTSEVNGITLVMKS